MGPRCRVHGEVPGPPSKEALPVNNSHPQSELELGHPSPDRCAWQATRDKLIAFARDQVSDIDSTSGGRTAGWGGAGGGERRRGGGGPCQKKDIGGGGGVS